MFRAPEGYVHGEDGLIVLVPARVAAVLARRGWIQRARAELAHRDAELAAVLIALEVAARAWSSTGGGTPAAIPTEPHAHSEQMNTQQAADILGITNRGVRKAIERGDLPAVQNAGRWQMSRTDLALYRTRKRHP